MFFLAKDAKTLGLHVIAMGANYIGDSVVQEVYEKQGWYYEQLLGINVAFSNDVGPGELFLMAGIPNGERQQLGVLKTRFS